MGICTEMLRQILINAIRLLSTLGLGLLALWGFAQLEGDSLAGYIALLGWRWVLSIPALGLEAAAVPALGLGRAGAMRQATAGLVATGLVSLGGALLFSGATNVIPVVVAGIWATMQVVMAPALARLLIAGHAGTHAVLMVARRALDPAALGLAILMSDGRVITSFYVILAIGITVVGLAAMALAARSGPLVADDGQPVGGLVMSAMAVSASQVAALRLPVLVLTLALPSDLAVAPALAFVMAGYIRQAATVAIIGLDAFVARHGIARSQLNRLVSGVFLALAPFAAIMLIKIELIMQMFISGLLPDIGDFRALLALLIAGVAIRILADLWIRVLSGRGFQVLLLPILLSHAVVQTAGLGLLAYLLPSSALALAMAAVFLLGQALLAFAIWLRFLARAASVPSLQAGSGPFP